MQKIIEQIQQTKNIIKITLSDTRTFEYKKIIIHPIIIKSQPLWQVERHTADKVFHSNITTAEMIKFFELSYQHFLQISFYYTDQTIIFSKRGDTYRAKTTLDILAQHSPVHDRQKSYLLAEGSPIPALVDLGVFSKDYSIIKSKFDKYKQINRLLEIIDQTLSLSPDQEFVVLDFGCGKSYLTFIIYYYLTKIKQVRAKIIGYDLKADVVEKCNQIAQKYGYDDLRFYKNDVTQGTPYTGKIDMVVTLHACDIATDYAMEFAINNSVRYVFSVPCCQHEINQQILPNGDYDILLKHGLIKERFCALLTDAIRAEILHQHGYNVDLLEFVDFCNSPKNILFRAQKTSASKPKNFDIDELCSRYGFCQTLYELTRAKK